MLARESHIHRKHHVVDFRGLPRTLLEAAVDLGEEIIHGRAHALGEGTVFDALASFSGSRAQLLQPYAFVERVGLLREHRPQRGIALHAALKEILFLLDALHHVLDDILILASQATKLAHLFVDARNAAVEYRARARSQGMNLG